MYLASQNSPHWMERLHGIAFQAKMWHYINHIATGHNEDGNYEEALPEEPLMHIHTSFTPCQ
ncbi:hypothetical protein BC830DRAFT_1147899 [Chytriomyces sp. MP71]|nr:hypothetical protein BC830DRAFT_1147899 [Chytriomyces sp. MP71]